jgi:O-antigen ligase
LLKAAGGFLIFFIATQSLRSEADVRLVLAAILASGLIQAALTALPVFNGTVALSTAARAAGTLVEANLFAGYLVLVIPLAIATGVAFRSRWALLPLMVVTLLFTVALVATLSRSGWLGLIGATGLLLILWPEQRKRVLALAGSVAVVLLVVGLFGPIGNRFGPGDSALTELASRWDVWTAAMRITLHHPLGVGVANFAYYFLPYSGGYLSHAHNLFLNMSAERGIIGLVAFIVVLVTLFRTLDHALTKAGHRYQRALTAGLIASFGGYVIHSIFDATYYDYKVLLLFWLLAGIGATLPTLFAYPTTDLAGAENSVPFPPRPVPGIPEATIAR